MINPVSLLSRLFASKGNEIQQAMEDFVDTAVVEPIAINGYGAPFKYINNQLIENVSSYELNQSVVVPELLAGDTYEVMIFSSGNFIERTWGVSGSKYLVWDSQLLTTDSPYGYYVVVDELDDTFSGLTINYRIFD